MSTESKKDNEVLEIEKEKTALKKAPLLTAPLQGVERRVAKINAYRSLLRIKLSLKGVPQDIKSEIEREFRYWAEDQMLALMGEYEERSFFTDEEIDALKGMASKIMAAAKGLSAPVNQSTVNQQPLNNQVNMRSPSTPRGPRETLPLNEIRRRDRESADYLQKLDQMDRGGPDF